MSSDGFIVVFDDTPLRSIELSLPESGDSFTGAQVLELAVSKASSAMQDVNFPEKLKSAALGRIGLDPDVAFKSKKFDREEAFKLMSDYFIAIADELKEDPLVVSVMDGAIIRLVMEDDDDFAMVAENVFTDLDTEDTGKLRKSYIPKAIEQLGIEMGIPPIAEFPRINDLVRKHLTGDDVELGQAQFAKLLQSILKELEVILAEKPYVYIQKMSCNNGSRLKKLLADEKQLQDAVDKIWIEAHKQKEKYCFDDILKNYLERNGDEVGVPPAEPDESINSLYDSVFSSYYRPLNVEDLTKEQFAEAVRKFLEKFLELLVAKPVLQDPEGHAILYPVEELKISD